MASPANEAMRQAWDGPEGAYWAELGVFLLIAVYLVALLPRLNAGTALVISGILFVALLAAHMALMMSALTYTRQPRIQVLRLTLTDVPNNLPSLMDIVRPWISSLGIGIADPDPEMLDLIE